MLEAEAGDETTPAQVGRIARDADEFRVSPLSWRTMRP
jgi:hypothetical protein